MRKAFFILASLAAVGCTTIPVTAPPEHKEVINPAQKILEPMQKTSIFYYYLDPINPTQAASRVRGNFVWRDHCLYLIDSDRKFYTAAFPEFPKGIVNWDEANKTLNLNGRIFKMGDYISTNGSYQRYAPNTMGGAEYEKQGNKKCLTPSIAKIGTFFD
ncbi:hypothetical protein [Psychrobacter sanguinis]|uniref:hypothetical protein n=1 Tax=Psychrobacter sanguinis TaxID=861445 RepID=UPI001917D23F|nr:hypothetical protein [Psychrobacter sanguinis]MCC3346491.1 hypothetical protein [Psychrobacter sanguinis]